MRDVALATFCAMLVANSFAHPRRTEDPGLKKPWAVFRDHLRRFAQLRQPFVTADLQQNLMTSPPENHNQLLAERMYIRLQEFRTPFPLHYAVVVSHSVVVPAFSSAWITLGRGSNKGPSSGMATWPLGYGHCLSEQPQVYWDSLNFQSGAPCPEGGALSIYGDNWGLRIWGAFLVPRNCMIFFAPIEHLADRRAMATEHPRLGIIRDQIKTCVSSWEWNERFEGADGIPAHSAPVDTTSIAECIRSAPELETFARAVAVAAVAVSRPGLLFAAEEGVNKGLTGSAVPFGDLFVDQPIINIVSNQRVQGQMQLYISVSFYSSEFVG